MTTCGNLVESVKKAMKTGCMLIIHISKQRNCGLNLKRLQPTGP